MDEPQPVSRQRAHPALGALLVLALLYTLYLTAEIVLPVLVASFLALVLGPVVVRLRRFGLPRGLAAGLVTALLVIGVGWGVEMLAAPAAEWLERAPQSVNEIERKLRPVKEPVEQVQRATKQVERLAGGEDDGRGTVTLKRFDLGALFVVSLGQLVAQSLVVIVMLYFLLASGERLIHRFAQVPRTIENRLLVVMVARRVRRDVASYLGTVTLVNIALGVVTGLTMWGLGVPNPALWGVVAAILNYVPYAGAMLNAMILAVVGLLSFNELWRGLLPAAAFLVLTTVESDLVTPMIVGRRLTLPPMLVFLSLLIWGWMWGVAGALLAVPILVVLRVAVDYVAAMRPLAPFLGGGNGPKLLNERGKGKSA